MQGHLKNSKTGGFIGLIVMIIVAVVLLRLWFDFDIIKWFNSPEVKDFFLKIKDIILLIWNKYLREAFHAIFAIINGIINKLH